MVEDKPPDPDRAAPHATIAPSVTRHPGVNVRGPAKALAPPPPDIFFAAATTARTPTIVTDPRLDDNPIVFANHAFLAMTGYEADEILGANCRFLQGPDTDAETVADLRRAIAERREYATEILNYRKDGYSFWNALVVSPVFDASGTLIYYFASQLDVTRRREAEDALRQAQKMEAIGRLTGGIAHDFNNLLQVMVGYLELIDSGLKKPELNIPKLQRSIENSRGAADRLSGLTHQLLTFARRQRIEGRPISLNDLFLSIRELAIRIFGKDVAIATNLADNLSNCRVDATRVEVALLNVMIHARAAMQGNAHKQVAIETRDVVVHREDMARHQNLAPGHYCSIAVSDNGPGLPADVLERVMDPFFTAKEDALGTGLGLSMVYGFAKQSGGIARISSTESVGTTIRLYFPAVEEAAEPARKDNLVLDRPGTETILVVEGRSDVAELARLILEERGYTIVRVANAEAALDAIDALGPIHLLFSDLIMPGGMNGVALAREAKRRRPDLKVLLTSGHAEASLERTEAGGSAFDLLDKPYGRVDLARKVRVILDGPTGVS